MAQAIVAYLHYLSIFLLFALLVLQHRPLRLPLDLSAPAAWRRSTAATASGPGGTGQRAGASWTLTGLLVFAGRALPLLRCHG